MKKIIKLICVVSVIAGIVMSQCLMTSAAVPPNFFGDVNYDRSISIDDATAIQKYAACIEDFSKRQLYYADVNGDGDVTIDDATLIQKYVARIIRGFEPEDYHIDTVSVNNFYASYDSGKAIAGVPVTFTAEATGGIEPFSYEFSINGEVLQAQSENNEFTYTFDNAGTYQIEVKYFNSFDEYELYTTEYTVVEPYDLDKPVISTIHLNTLNVTTASYRVVLTANAIGGDAPYEYSFDLDNGVEVQDFSESNEFTIPTVYYLNDYEEQRISAGEHTVTVQVKDSSGNCVTEEYTFNVTEAVPA